MGSRSQNTDDVPVQGRWGRVATRHREQTSTTPPPLAWEETPPIATRLVRAVGVPGLVGAAVFIIALLCTVWFVFQGLGTEEPLANQSVGIMAGTSESEEDALPDDAASQLSTAGNASDEDELLVHVVGEVNRTGVVTLSAGARVVDAIEAAGGATPAALLHEMNLARAVVDGERIIVPNAETLHSLEQMEMEERPKEGPSGGGAGLININVASVSELQSLPGIGPALAERIVAWREGSGPFTSAEQLLEVSGIGAHTFEGLKDRVTV